MGEVVKFPGSSNDSRHKHPKLVVCTDNESPCSDRGMDTASASIRKFSEMVNVAISKMDFENVDSATLIIRTAAQLKVLLSLLRYEAWGWFATDWQSVGGRSEISGDKRVDPVIKDFTFDVTEDLLARKRGLKIQDDGRTNQMGIVINVVSTDFVIEPGELWKTLDGWKVVGRNSRNVRPGQVVLVRDKRCAAPHPESYDGPAMVGYLDSPISKACEKSAMEAYLREIFQRGYRWLSIDGSLAEIMGDEFSNRRLDRDFPDIIHSFDVKTPPPGRNCVPVVRISQ